MPIFVYTITMIRKNILPILLFILSVVAVVACNDLDNYSTNPDHRLTFSHEKLMLDTILTEVGTSTHILKVYNRNKKALLISSIHLANSQRSGFRMNVDGVKGNYHSEVEIREHDSLFIFIEAMIPANEKDAPVLKKDSIVFITNGVMQEIKLQAYGQDHIEWKGKIITENKIIEDKRPIVIYDSLCIAENVTLTLKKGVRLLFHGKAEMKIKGQLIAEGTVNEPICFRGDRTDKVFSYLPYNNLPGQWGGMHFYASSKENRLINVDIHGSKYGILCESDDATIHQLTVINSSIHQVQTDGVKLVNSNARFVNSQLSNAGNHCAYLLGGNYEFIHCTLANYYNWSVKSGVALYFRNELDNTPYPLTQLNFKNSIIAGSSNDELKGIKSTNDDIDFNYKFISCLMNTTEIKNDRVKDVIWCKDDNFVLIDKRTQSFNYRLNGSSAAIGVANKEVAKEYPLDKLGRSRVADEKPDSGCYEWIAENE